MSTAWVPMEPVEPSSTTSRGVTRSFSPIGHRRAQRLPGVGAGTTDPGTDLLDLVRGQLRPRDGDGTHAAPVDHQEPPGHGHPVARLPTHPARRLLLVHPDPGVV